MGNEFFVVDSKCNHLAKNKYEFTQIKFIQL